MAALLAMAVALGALLPIGTTSAEGTPSPRYNCVMNGLLLQSWLPCDYGTKVPDLLNPMFLLEDVNAFGTLYGATDEQRAALNSFQHRAVRNIMALHGLPASDYQAVKAWARPEALEELWAMVIDAIETHPEVRTEEQRLVSEWMHKVVDRQRNAGTEQAARE